MIYAAIIFTAGLAWLAYEVVTAPVVDDEGTGPDPYLAEDIRAALNSCEGYPIPSASPLPVARAPGASNAPRQHREQPTTGGSFRTPESGAVSPHAFGRPGTPDFCPFSHSPLNTQKGR